MPGNLFTLGAIAFRAGAINLHGYSRSREYRHNFVDAIRGEGARNYTGKGADVITLTGVVFPGQYGNAKAPDELAAQARVGQPLELIDGAGYLLGRYVILNISDDRSEILEGGTGRQVSYSISLRKDPIPLANV